MLAENTTACRCCLGSQNKKNNITPAKRSLILFPFKKRGKGKFAIVNVNCHLQIVIHQNISSANREKEKGNTKEGTARVQMQRSIVIQSQVIKFSVKKDTKFYINYHTEVGL